jgi:hypothetical protein
VTPISPIYAFRGATIRNINDFETDFPGATVVMLEQNYRSTQTILSAANAVIVKNEGRKPKKLWSDSGDGDLITGYVADSEHDEASFVAREIDALRDAGKARYADCAVFYRTNAQSRAFEEVFIRLGLPYKVVGGCASTSGARCGTPSPTCARSPTGRRRVAAAHPQRAQAGDRRQGRRPPSRRWRPRSRSASARRCAGAEMCPAWQPVTPSS